VRRSFLFVALTFACGARSELGDVPAFAVLYAADATHLARWHSATGAIEVFEAPDEVLSISCTRDGRFIALADAAALQFVLLDGSGKLLRTQHGGLEAIRRDGKRVIAGNVDPSEWPNNCVGTLDADGTYANEQCWPDTTWDGVGASDYSADGTTVLWGKGHLFETWTIATASENGDDWHPIASGTGATLDQATWSPDGARVAFMTTTFDGTTDVSKISMVQVDTLDIETVVDDHVWIGAFGFTPDGGAIVYLEAPLAEGYVVSKSVRRMDLRTHEVVSLDIDVQIAPPFWGPICVTSD
jgi:hypothetical protein